MTKVVEGYRLDDREYVPTVTAKDDATIHIPPFGDLEIRLSDIWRPAKFS